MLFHVSEESGIVRFEPRPSQYTDEPVVWAVDAQCNELRDVATAAGPKPRPYLSSVFDLDWDASTRPH
jgi:hypothetical protein